MPKIIYMTNQAVFIECEYVPEQAKGQDEAKLAEEVAATICRKRCGYYRDAQMRKIQLYCFNPKSPHLAELKKKLAEQGTLKTT